MQRLIKIAVVLLLLAGCIRVTDTSLCPTEPATGSDLVSGLAVNLPEPVKQQVTLGNSELTKKIVTEGELVQFPNLAATDPDGDPITYTFTAPLDSKGHWQTKAGDAGEYLTKITISDGNLTQSEDILIIVKVANQKPLISGLSDLTVSEGETVTLNPTITDGDGDEVSVRFRGWKEKFPYTTTFKDAGVHTVIVEASDGKDTVRSDVTITVKNVNRPPVLEPFKDQTITEKDKVTVRPQATDLDEDKIKFTFSKPLDANGAWQTKEGDAGKYEVQVNASDGTDTASTSFFIFVNPINQPPSLQGVKDITVEEGQTVVTSITAEDPEGKPVEVIFSGWMTSATKETDYDDAGTYQVTVTASDGAQKKVETFVVTVKEKNRPPVFGPGAFD